MTKKAKKTHTQRRIHKKHILITAAALLVIIGLCTGITLALPKKPVVAFYNIPAQAAENVQAVLGDDFTYRTLGADRPLDWLLSQGKKPDMVVTTSGKALEEAKAAASPRISLGTGILQDMTSSIRAIAQKDGKEIKAVPLLSTHLEVAVNTQELRKTGIKTINSWGDFERFAKLAAEKNGTKVLFAGKDSALFLDVLGAMAESLNGAQQYKNAAQLIEIALDKASARKAKLNAAELANTLGGTPDAPLYDTLRMLNRWYKEGILFPEVFAIDQTSVAALMGNGNASAVIMSLNDHRAVSHTVIEKYASVYFPSNIPAHSRVFTAPVYLAIPLKNTKPVIIAAKQLTTTARQEQLSRSTGLAPVLARCRTPDKQADDVRYWVAATNEPLAGLSRDVSLPKSQQEQLAAELAALVRFGSF